MRLRYLATWFAAAGLLGSSMALAQNSTTRIRPQQPVRPAVHSHGTYYQDETSPSDLPPDAPPAPPGAHGTGGYAPTYSAPSCEAPSCEAPCAPTCEASCGNGCGNGCGSCCNGCGDWCNLGEPWVLFDGCFLEKCNTTIAGYVDQGITFNADSPNDRFNGPQTFNDRDREYQLNQVYLYIDKTADTECQTTDWGYRVDLLYGTDWRWTPQIGWEIEEDGTRRWNQDHRFYGLAVPQAYWAFKLNDLEIDVGRFYTSAGYEVVTSTGNFFYSHAYTHQYFEPFTHTGVMAKYQVNDNLMVHLCGHQGWDQFEDINDDPSLLTGFTWTSCDQKTSLAFAMTYGDEANELFFTNRQNRYYQGIVFTRQVNDKLKYVAHSDYGHQEEVGGAGTDDAEWYSISQYLIYTVNDCLSYGFRYEASRDDDGFRVFGFGAAEAAFNAALPPLAQAGADSPPGFIGGGYAGTFQTVTLGLNYKPHANLVLRPEVRWDWYDGLPSGINGRPLPFNDGTEDDQFTVATDLIFTY